MTKGSCSFVCHDVSLGSSPLTWTSPSCLVMMMTLISMTMITTRMLMMCLSWCHREFTFDVDVSQLPCGLNGALYFVEMDEDGGKGKFPTNKVDGIHLCVFVSLKVYMTGVSLFENDYISWNLTKYSHIKVLRPEPRSALATATLNVRLTSSLSTGRPTAWTGPVTPNYTYICCPATMINSTITIMIRILIRELGELRNWSLWILLRGTWHLGGGNI